MKNLFTPLEPTQKHEFVIALIGLLFCTVVIAVTLIIVVG